MHRSVLMWRWLQEPVLGDVVCPCIELAALWQVCETYPAANGAIVVVLVRSENGQTRRREESREVEHLRHLPDSGGICVNGKLAYRRPKRAWSCKSIVWSTVISPLGAAKLTGDERIPVQTAEVRVICDIPNAQTVPRGGQQAREIR